MTEMAPHPFPLPSGERIKVRGALVIGISIEGIPYESRESFFSERRL